MKTDTISFRRIRHFIMVILLIAIDQVSKYLIRARFEQGESIDVIPNVFQILFHKNDGAVFGFLSGTKNSVIYLTIFTFLMLGLILFLYFRIPDIKKYQPLLMIIVFIFAGAIGNLIDRIMLGYVTDFLYIQLIDFPVFNMADCYITFSSFIVIFLILVRYKDDDLDFLSLKKKKEAPETQGDEKDGI